MSSESGDVVVPQPQDLRSEFHSELDSIRSEAPRVEENLRAADARAVAALPLPLGLLEYFASDNLSVSAPVLAAASLDAGLCPPRKRSGGCLGAPVAPRRAPAAISLHLLTADGHGHGRTVTVHYLYGRTVAGRVR